MSRIVFLGNFNGDFSSETHHKKTLEALGHEVIPFQEAVATSDEVFQEASKSDAFIWIHTHGWQTPGVMKMDAVLTRLKQAGIPSLTYHLDLWLGLRRQRDLRTDPVYKHIEYFFTVDKRMADWFNTNTTVKGHYLQAGVFEPECYIHKSVAAPGQDVTFVGSRGYHPEWQYRPQLIDWLKKTYGNRFVHVGGDGQIPTTRGDMLNLLYANSKVVVGDSLCINFDYPYYWSDRVYETLGRGGFIIHPYIQGMEDHFEDGKHLVFYKFNDFDDLKSKIDYYVEHDNEREAIRTAGHEHVKANHTYTNRWQTILKELEHGRNGGSDT